MASHMGTAGKADGFAAFGMNFASEREAIIGLIDKIQVAEACAGAALANWAKNCKIPALRGGLLMIAEREAFHGRVFSQRIHDLGGECEAVLDPFSVESEACLADPTLTDLEKLQNLVERNGDPETLIRPVLAFAELLTEDLETKEALKLYYADEISSGNWLRDMCQTLSASEPVRVGIVSNAA
jgi:hypothetical protein